MLALKDFVPRRPSRQSSGNGRIQLPFRECGVFLERRGEPGRHFQQSLPLQLVAPVFVVDGSFKVEDRLCCGYDRIVDAGRVRVLHGVPQSVAPQLQKVGIALALRDDAPQRGVHEGGRGIQLGERVCHRGRGGILAQPADADLLGTVLKGGKQRVEVGLKLRRSGHHQQKGRGSGYGLAGIEQRVADLVTQVLGLVQENDERSLVAAFGQQPDQ